MAITTQANPALTLVPPRSAIWTLARKEGWRLVGHPVFLVTVALTGLTLWGATVSEPTWSTQKYAEVAASAFSFLPVGTAIAAGWALTREQAEGEWFPGVPLNSFERARARLLALLWPTAVTAAVVLATWLVVVIQGGIATGDAPTTVNLTPDLFTMACVPAAVLMVGACAYGLASLSRLAGTVVAGFATAATTIVSWAFAPVFWMTPFVLDGFEVAQPRDFDPGGVTSGTILLRPDEYESRWRIFELAPKVSAAHLVYLLAMTGLWGALALNRARSGEPPDDGARRQVRTLARGSAVLAVAACVAQIVLRPA